MNSGGHRGFTVVTIVTLIFAPIFFHHAWTWRFVGQTKTTHVEQCAPAPQPCPAQRVVVNVVYEPAPSNGGGDQGGGFGGSNHGDVGQGGPDQGVDHQQDGGNQGGGGDRGRMGQR